MNCFWPLYLFHIQQPTYLPHRDFLLLSMRLNLLSSQGLLFCTKFYTLHLSDFHPIIRFISSIPVENTRQKMVSIYLGNAKLGSLVKLVTPRLLHCKGTSSLFSLKSNLWSFTLRPNKYLLLNHFSIH